MPTTDTQTTDELTLQSATVGYPHVPASTLLTRLNYFDGKFLRADDLRTEQEYHRRHVELSNRGGGSGVAEGFDVSAGGSGDLLSIGAGLAIDGAGRVLYLPDRFSASLADVVARSSRAAELQAKKNGNGAFTPCLAGETGGGGPTAGAEFYLLTISHAEDACGNEDVYGKLCEDACATDEQRRYLVEGIVLRARPFRPRTPFATSKAVALTERHVRSQLASAWFADETEALGTPMSAEWIRSTVWCHASNREHGSEVPIAIVGRLATGLFVDEWIVRRERIDGPPRRYWAWNMAMRPWEVFLAQILQFQCQLRSQGLNGGAPGYTDPCQPHAEALAQAERYIQQVEVSNKKLIQEIGAANKSLEHIDLTQLREKFQKLRDSVSAPAQSLVDAGIVELPSAGYLPVLPGGDPSVEDQVRRLMGAGVDLRFCVVRADYVPHAVEEAQHMERISLLAGLDSPAAKPKVDILVPDATIVDTKPPETADLFDTEVVFAPGIASQFLPQARAAKRDVALAAPQISLHGAGRAKKLDSGGAAFYLAGGSELHPSTDATTLLDLFTGAATPDPKLGVAPTELMAQPAARARIMNALGKAGAQAQDFLAAPAGATAFQPPAKDAAPVSLWAELEAPENPFALELGQSTKLSLLVDLSIHTTEALLATLDLHGVLVVKRKVRVSQGVFALHCEFTGTSAIEASLGGKTIPAQYGSPKFPVTLTMADTTSGLRLQVSVENNPMFHPVFAAQWNAGHPRRLNIEAGYVGTALTEKVLATGVKILPLFVAILKEDPTVGEDSNDLHRIALHVLDVIEAALGKSDFAATAKLKLFPTPAAPTGQTLAATRDWVLFQRRRTADCLGPPAPIPVPVPLPEPTKTVRYRVYETAASAMVAKFLASHNEGRLKPILTPVGDVEFAADSDALTSDPTTLVSDWSNVSPKPRIVYAAVVTDEADVQLTLESRVHAYEDAVSGVSVVDADAPVELYGDLTSFHDGADGFMVFATAPPATVCHHVYYTLLIDAMVSAIKKLEAGGDLATFLKETQAVDAGRIVFTPGTPKVVNAALTKLTGLANAVEFAVAAASPDAGTEPLPDQLKAIVKEMNGVGDVTVQGVTVEGWDDDCPFVTVLLAFNPIS